MSGRSLRRAGKAGFGQPNVLAIAWNRDSSQKICDLVVVMSNRFHSPNFLHISEKVPDGHRKWDDMLKRTALATQSESKRNVPGDSRRLRMALGTAHQLLKDLEPEVINQPPCRGRACP